MKPFILLITFLVTLSLLFTGCGEEKNTSIADLTPSTGTFVDAPVHGLFYKTPTQTGFTDANGQFKYIIGEDIEFQLGNIPLGKGKADTLVTPYTISQDNETVVKNIALLLQNFDNNKNDTVLDISALKGYNFHDFNISAPNDEILTKLTALLSNGDFQTRRGGDDFNPITTESAKKNLDTYLSLHSVKYNKKFTQAYLDSTDFYQADIEEEGGNQRMRFRNGERQVVGDYDFTESGGFNATFDNPSDYYTEPFTLKDGAIIMDFGRKDESFKVATQITKVTKTSITTVGTVIESVMPEYPVGMTKSEIWYTSKKAAIAFAANRAAKSTNKTSTISVSNTDTKSHDIQTTSFGSFPIESSLSKYRYPSNEISLNIPNTVWSFNITNNDKSSIYEYPTELSDKNQYIIGQNLSDEIETFKYISMANVRYTSGGTDTCTKVSFNDFVYVLCK